MQELIFTHIEKAKKLEIELFLTNCINLEENKSPLEFYKMAELYNTIPSGVSWKEAVLMPLNPKAAEGMYVYETITRNRGFDIKLFDNRKDALEWLLEK